MNRMIRTLGSGLMVAVVVVLLGGCAAETQTSKQARNGVNLYYISQYPQAAATFKSEAQKKDENFVLNNCRWGSAAIAAYQVDEAEAAFMNAYDVINGTKTNDAGRTLGASVVFEGVKVWKGEPFERAMAHYYLGMLFLMKNDPENARAAFQNSIFKLREYAKESVESKDKDAYKVFESNFALGYFGLGFSYMRLNKSELAEANFDIARKLDGRLGPVIADAQKPGVNTLIFVDAFQGPRRSPKGWYNEESAFGPSPAEAGPVPPIAAFADGQPINSQNVHYDMVDTLALGQDQRWQDIDTLRKTKAVIGTGAMAAGAGVTAYGADRGDAGTALVGVGIMALGAALAASSQADCRYWETLPRTVYVIPAALPPGEHEIQVAVGGGRSTLKATIQPPGAGGPRDTVMYFRMINSPYATLPGR